MNVYELTLGQYVTAAELGDARRSALIHAVRSEQFDGRSRPSVILKLVASTGHSWPRELVLNVTNLREVMNGYGPETDSWLGKPIEVTTALTTNPQGQRVRGIVVTVSRATSTPSGAIPLGAPASTGNGASNDSAQTMQTGPTSSAAIPQAAPATTGPVRSAPSGDLDDEIPF